MMSYSQKYLKYKQKYLQLKKSITGGMFANQEDEEGEEIEEGEGTETEGEEEGDEEDDEEEVYVYEVSYCFTNYMSYSSRQECLNVYINAVDENSAINSAWPLIYKELKRSKNRFEAEDVFHEYKDEFYLFCQEKIREENIGIPPTLNLNNFIDYIFLPYYLKKKSEFYGKTIDKKYEIESKIKEYLYLFFDIKFDDFLIRQKNELSVKPIRLRKVIFTTTGHDE
jgi:hypothetical protein